MSTAEMSGRIRNLLTQVFPGALNNHTRGFLIVAIISLLFQLFTMGYEGDNRATTPDTDRYLAVAEEIQLGISGKGRLDGDVLRTPGYPVFILLAAKSAGVEMTEVQLPVRNWDATNDAGKRLVLQIVKLQEALGFMIPLLIYSLAMTLGATVPLAILASFSYFLDISTVSFQYVLLNDTLSIFVMLCALLVAIRAFMKPTFLAVVLAGLVSGVMIIVRPPLAILPLMLCVAAYTLFHMDRISLRHSTSLILSFLGTAAILPLFWAAVNLHGTGHFFLTQNATLTLQNFAAPHFIELDVSDPELQTLQKYAKMHLEQAREAGIDDRSAYAFSHAFEEVENELGLSDPMYVYSIASRANRKAILSEPVAFVSGGLKRWAGTWVRSFRNVKNRYLQRRIANLGPAAYLFGPPGYLLLGPATILFFLTLVPYSAYLMPPQCRVWFLAIGGFVLAYSLATSLADENESIRHSMHVRVLVNTMLMASIYVIGKKKNIWARLVARFLPQRH